MIPYIFALKNQTNGVQAQVTGDGRKIRQVQAQVAQGSTVGQDLGGRVAAVKDTLRQTSAQLASVGIKSDQALSNTVSLGSDLESAKRQLQVQVSQLSQAAEETSQLAQSVQADARRHTNQINSHLASHDTSILRYSEALSGNIKLYAEAIAADLSAAALNAAAAGTFTRDLTVSLVSQMGEGEEAVRYVHPWALLPAIITAEASADPDIDPPEVKDHDDPLATPQFQAGLLHLVVILDTDAGVTKTYAENDEVSVTVKVSATVGSTPGTSKLLGWDVPDFTMTYNVIA